jgi:superfamily II DNA or RNA helicase
MLRDYQKQTIDAARQKLFVENKQSIVIQSATGSGKTVLVTAITKIASERKHRCWFVVPRKELVKQSKAHFTKWGIPFGIIDAQNKESRAYNVHIISLQTLMRRLDKIKGFPDVVFFDECHLNYDAQQKIMRYFKCAECESSFYSPVTRICREKEMPCREIKACAKWSVA